MSWTQTLKKTAGTLKRTLLGDTLIRRSPLYYPQAFKRFQYLSQAPLEERRAFTQRRLKVTLAVARRTPYGRRVGGGLSIESWPLLTKEQVRDCPYDFLACPAWRTIPASTSGTTGTPLKLFRSPSSVAVEQAAIDYTLKLIGASFQRQRIAILRGDDIKDPKDQEPPFWRYDVNGKRLVFSSNHLSPRTFPYFLDELLRFQPDGIYAYPSVLESFCLLLQKAGKRLSLAYCVTSSEKPSPILGTLIQQVLGCRWIDYYGQAERLGFAYQIDTEGYRFLPGYAYVELLPVESEGDETLHEIVGTTLWNLAMPLLRYRTGDLIRLPACLSQEQLEALCYGCVPFSGIEGRSKDYLVSPEGAVLIALNHLPRDVENVVRMQVIQERPDFVRILVVPTADYSHENEAQIWANVHRKLPPNMQVQIEVVQELERTAQGKTPFVIRRF